MSKINFVSAAISVLWAVISILAGALSVLFELIPSSTEPPLEQPSAQPCAYLWGINSDGGYFLTMPKEPDDSPPYTLVYVYRGHGNPPKNYLDLLYSEDTSLGLFGVPLFFKWGNDDHEDPIKVDVADWAAFIWPSSCSEIPVVEIVDLREKTILTTVPVESEGPVLVFAPLVEKGQKEEMQESETNAYPPPPPPH